jgi:hypothetical protein
MENCINRRAWDIRRDVAKNAGVEVSEINWYDCYITAREEYQLNETLRDSDNNTCFDFVAGLTLGFCALLSVIVFF